MKILVVDDNRMTLNLVADLLKKFNYEISVSEIGLDVFRIIQDGFIPDLILLDIQLPDVSGIDVCKLLKENKDTKDIPVLFLSAFSDQDTILKALAAGGTDYISKPFETQELLARINTQLKLKSAQDELKFKNEELNKYNMLLQNELNMARLIHNKLILQEFPKIQNINFGKLYQPLITVGGDYFDIIKINDEIYSLIIGDVSGHGVKAALLAAFIKSYINIFTNEINTPDKILTKLNISLLNTFGLAELFYITMCIGYLNINDNIFSFSTAGHPLPWYYNKEEDKVGNLQNKGAPLGVIKEVEFKTEHKKLHSGDKVVLYTDGLIEHFNKFDEPLQMELFLNKIKENADNNIQDIINSLFTCVVNNKKNSEFLDDIAVLGFEVL